MSKVQSPESSSLPRSVNASVARPDSGHWALDVGLRETLDGGLRVTDLRKGFLSPAGESIEVLRGISFAAEPGQSVAIMGASGAGKSTLLHLLGGLETPDHGSIALGRFEIDCAQPPDLARFRSEHVGFVFQFHYLLADLSAAENVALPLLIARTGRGEAMQRAVQTLDELGLGGRCMHPVSHLSGGEQQRVAACRALITQPSLVLADEPTGNLDASFADELGALLLSYSRRRRAIVIVATHNERLAQLCDRILIISNGRVAGA